MKKEDSTSNSNDTQSNLSNYHDNVPDYRKLIIQMIRKINNREHLKKIYSFSKVFLED